MSHVVRLEMVSKATSGKKFGKLVFWFDHLGIIGFFVNVKNNMVFVHFVLTRFFVAKLPSTNLHVNIHVNTSFIFNFDYRLLLPSTFLHSFSASFFIDI